MLSAEIINKILQTLDICEWRPASCVCKQWAAVCKSLIAKICSPPVIDIRKIIETHKFQQCYFPRVRRQTFEGELQFLACREIQKFTLRDDILLYHHGY